MTEVTSLGYLVWYNVAQDAGVDYNTFNKLVRKNKAGIKPFKKPKAVNVFRRACESIDGTHNGWHYKMVDQGFNKLYVQRNLVRTQGLLSEVIGSATMTKDDGLLTWVSPDYSYVDWAKELISNFLQEHETTIHSLPIREATRKVIENNLRGVLVKQGGGVYFVAESEYTKLQSLASTINSIDGAKVLMAPLVDTVEQREMLMDALRSYLDIQIAEITGELDSAGEVIPAKKIKDWGLRVNELLDRCDFYSSILGAKTEPLELTNLKNRIDSLWEK